MFYISRRSHKTKILKFSPFDRMAVDPTVSCITPSSTTGQTHLTSWPLIPPPESWRWGRSWIVSPRRPSTWSCGPRTRRWISPSGGGARSPHECLWRMKTTTLRSSALRLPSVSWRTSLWGGWHYCGSSSLPGKFRNRCEFTNGKNTGLQGHFLSLINQNYDLVTRYQIKKCYSTILYFYWWSK